MSRGLAAGGADVRGRAEIASSAAVVGVVRLGDGALIAQGAVLRSDEAHLHIGAGSAVLENSVVVGGQQLPTTIGRRSTFGHRCVVIGASIGDLCEIGNASILMPDTRVGDRVFLGEGTLVPSGMVLPDGAVAVGRPARIIRDANDFDLERLQGLRGGDLSLPAPSAFEVGSTMEGSTVAQLYDYRGITPTIASTAVLFPSAEITGDVVIGERTIIGAGVKIIGDSHGPVRIGDDVQILENTVLHLLPDNQLVIDDGAIIGPAAMIHGCHIGAGTVVEPGAIVCDGSSIGERSVVRAGAVVKQRSRFDDRTEIDGFPAAPVSTIEPPPMPAWAFSPDDLPRLARPSSPRSR
jgi:carbonic anhydrase/acetyltransferase-like protein (isoleucine patch superfamily)